MTLFAIGFACGAGATFMFAWVLLAWLFRRAIGRIKP